MNKPRIRALFQSILNLPILTWVFLGFLISYLLFFVSPIFFSLHVMDFPRYVPSISPAGSDLKQILGFCRAWFILKQTPFIGTNEYPPVENIFFIPLLFVKFSLAYRIITFINVSIYILMTLILPLQIGKGRQATSLIILVFVTGLLSYAFQFELERGQYNVITVFICLLAIWIYHYHNKFRFIAYILFSLSVQLKIYPFIFIVMLISDWHDWKSNLKRFLALTLTNFALFFALGPAIFMDFIRAILAKTVKSEIDINNHSIRSFVVLASQYASQHGWTWLKANSIPVQLALLIICIGCIFLIMLRAYRQKQNGLNPYLLLACTIGASLIAPISHDYKLSILAAPVAILLAGMTFFPERAIRPSRTIVSTILILILSTAYSSTLFSYTNKTYLLQNNCPALFMMLFTVTLLSFVHNSSGLSASKKLTDAAIG